MFRKLRIIVLLLILWFVALNTYFDRVYSTDWDIPLRVAVYPINADGSQVAAHYIEALELQRFAPLEHFFAVEGKSYGVPLQQPVRFFLGPPVNELPPKLTADAALPSAMLWSLRTRYWA